MDLNKISESLIQLIDNSRKRNFKNETIIFEINENVSNMIYSELKINVSEYKFQIDIYSIRHIFKEHGNAKKEADRGQIAVTEKDIILIPEILQTPDIVLNSGKNKLGKDTITFIKYFDDKYVVINEIREGRKTISLNTMRIFKTKRTKIS